MKKTVRLRELINSDKILVAPGASTALMAKVIEDSGFSAVYATGAGIANMQFGIPDLGMVTMTEILETASRINNITSLPVIADIDNGYGNYLNVYRTVQEFTRAGIAGLQMEDQVLPKRCGHFQGKAIIPKEEMIGKIKAAKDAMLDRDTVLIARTDAIAVEGFDKAIERALAYVEAGADVIFVEAPRNREQLEQIPKLITKPTLANMVEGGVTPIISNQELEKMGYKIVLYANAPLKAAILGIQRLLDYLKENQTTDDCEDLMITMKERNRLTGLDYFNEIEKKYI